MPPSLEDRLKDILDAISDLDELLADITDVEQFKADRFRRLASERCLEVICEAAQKLPEEVKRQGSDIDWRKMTNFANLLRHAYHNTQETIVWDVIETHLPVLKKFVEGRITGTR